MHSSKDGEPCIPALFNSSISASFDHLVGSGEERRRHLKAECLGGLQVNDRFGNLIGILQSMNDRAVTFALVAEDWWER
jgi:hypothetical protein